MTDVETTRQRPGGVTAIYDVLIVGAGFAGMYMLHKLRGLGFSARVFDAAGGVGGTWYWNRYPGARCDVESVDYSLSFDPELEQEWEWEEKYATQPEILRYANHVADRYQLWPDMQFNTRIESAHFNETSGRWIVRTDQGDVVSAQHVVMAVGTLSAPKLPEIPGIETYQGASYQTQKWPHEGGRLLRQTGGGHRHRLVGHSVDSDHRRPGGPSHRVPTDARTTACRPATGRRTPKRSPG